MAVEAAAGEHREAIGAMIKEMIFTGTTAF